MHRTLSFSAIYMACVQFMLAACTTPPLENPPNQVSGTWSLVTANMTTQNVTSPLYGDNPVGILIFAPTLYYSELLTVDPATLPRFASDVDRTTGTAEQNAAVIAGMLGQIGQYNVSADGSFESEIVIASTFPNWIGLHRNISMINETVEGNYMRERLHDSMSETVINILWKREGLEK